TSPSAASRSTSSGSNGSSRSPTSSARSRRRSSPGGRRRRSRRSRSPRSRRRRRPSRPAPRAERHGNDQLVLPHPPPPDPLAPLDAGDVPRLQTLLDEPPELARDRLDAFEGYFARPYLLWFVAENPIRNRRLPPNIAEVTRFLLAAAERA